MVRTVVVGQHIVTTLRGPVGTDVIEEQGREEDKFFRQIIAQFPEFGKGGLARPDIWLGDSIGDISRKNLMSLTLVAFAIYVKAFVLRGYA